MGFRLRLEPCRSAGAVKRLTTARLTFPADHPRQFRVMTSFKLFPSFRFSGTLMNYHSDEKCGQVDGTLQPLTAMLNRQMG